MGRMRNTLLRNFPVLRKRAVPVSLDPTESVFRAFSDAEFIPEYESWSELRRLLHGNGGAFGIAGPRGSGKTWLISKSVHWAEENYGVGLWFPSPSDYGAEAFLRALADNFASSVMRRFPYPAPGWFLWISSPWLLGLCGVLVLLVSMLGISPPNPFLIFGDCGTNLTSPYFAGCVAHRIPWGSSYGYWGNLILAMWLVLYLLILMIVIGIYLKKYWPNGYLYTRAMDLKLRVRYSETLSRNLDSSLSLSKVANVGVALKSQKSLAERAMTIASLVFEFREFMQQVAERSQGPIVIGIDELDKIHEAEKAKALLRDVKGIFEVNGVHFLVSVSDEAKKTLNLGALQERDEFNSSFYTVIEILPNTPQECASLLESRTRQRLSREARLALGILGGGNFREVVRLANISLGTKPVSPSISLDEALSMVIRAEARAVCNEVLNADLPDPLKLTVYKSMDPDHFSIDCLLDKNKNLPRLEDLLPDGIPVPATADHSTSLENFSSLWLKFFIRFLVVKKLMEVPAILGNDELEKEFQNVVSLISSSAEVAEYCLQNLEAAVQSAAEVP